MDYNFGISQEVKLQDLLIEKFGALKKTPTQYDLFDFEGDNLLVELKSRRCNHDTYPDTMIGYNKIEYAINNPDKKVIFCFNFKDGLYYHTFKPDYDYTPKIAGRCDRGRPEFKKHSFIKIKDLILL